MGFFFKTHEEKAAAADLKREKEALHVAKLQAKAAKVRAKAERVTGKKGIVEAHARRVAAKLQRAEEREEARYVSATDRLERDRAKGKARVVRVRGSRRARGHRRSRPRR
jgi:hypothetical protein